MYIHFDMKYFEKKNNSFYRKETFEKPFKLVLNQKPLICIFQISIYLYELTAYLINLVWNTNSRNFLLNSHAPCKLLMYRSIMISQKTVLIYNNHFELKLFLHLHCNYIFISILIMYLFQHNFYYFVNNYFFSRKILTFSMIFSALFIFFFYFFLNFWEFPWLGFRILGWKYDWVEELFN